MIADTPGRTHPVAHISRSALVANVQTVPREVYADISHDGWGHGADLLTEVARERGLAGVVVNGDPRPFAGEAPDNFTMLTAAAMCGFLPQTEPALRLTGRVLSIKPLLRGESVSYGYTFTAGADTNVALVTGGYAQGIVRSLGNTLTVSVGGTRCRIVGRVAMDACVVDIGEHEVSVGDEAVFLGNAANGEPSIIDWTEITGLTAEELVLPLGLRANRKVVA